MALILAATGGLAGTAQAQGQGGGQNGGKPSSDIVVTAQRREEKLKDVPLTVTVVSGERIERDALATIKDVIEQLPQVSFQTTGDMRTDTLSIRGLSSVSNAAGVEPDAAIVIDGETLARTMQMNGDAMDVERMEVLEGPQGTLFGKNAVAGLVNIVTRGPKLADRVSGRAYIGIAEDNEYRLKASLNIPVTDTTAIYLNGYGSYNGGWEKNVHADQPNAGQSTGAGLRGQFLFKPSPSFSVVLRGEYTYKKSGIIPYAFKSLTQADVIKASTSLSGGTRMVDQFNKLLAASGIDLLSGSIINGTKSYLYDDRTWDDMHSDAFSGTITKDFGHSSLHYMAAYRYYNLFSNDNEWGVSAPQLTNSPDGLNVMNYGGPSIEKTIQSELRWQSTDKSPFQYVAGAFYYYNSNYHHEINKTCNDAVYGAYNGTKYPNPNPVNAVSGFNCTGGYVGHYNITNFVTTTHTHNEALFGDVQYNLWHGLTAFGGARVLWEQQDMTLQHVGDDNIAKKYFDAANPYGELAVSDKRSAFTHRLGLKYDFGPVMIYGTQSTGFKGVSWDDYAQAPRSRAAQPLAPERPNQWEVGMRGSVAHGRFDWSVSAFDLVNRHFQVRTVIRDPSYQLAVADAGTAHTRGMEFNANLKITRGLKIGGNYNWLPKATLTDDVFFKSRTGYINYKGVRLPNAPIASYNAYVEYGFRTPFATSLDSTLRFNLRHRGLQSSVLTDDKLQDVDPYTIVDGSYTLTPGDSRWTATLYVKNIFNQLYYQRAYEPAVIGWSAGQMAYLPRDYKRYFGGNISYKF